MASDEVQVALAGGPVAELGDVAAGTERAARAAQQDDPAVVRVRRRERGLELRGCGVVECVVELARFVDELVEVARDRTDRRGRRLVDDAALAARLATCRAECAALRAMTLAEIGRNARRSQPGPESSMMRLFGAELTQRVRRLAVDLLGDDSLAAGAERRWTEEWLYSYANTIAAGAKDIQRNIIGERVLGLPKGR